MLFQSRLAYIIYAVVDFSVFVFNTFLFELLVVKEHVFGHDSQGSSGNCYLIED